jgi:hypothetical protein
MSSPGAGKDLVECLVCTHTNLHLEHRLEIYETVMFPWDLEMTVEKSLSDDEDEDGVPQCVSDSDSESENDCDHILRHVTRRVSVYHDMYILSFIFYLHIFDYILSSELVQTKTSHSLPTRMRGLLGLLSIFNPFHTPFPTLTQHPSQHHLINVIP